MSYYPIGFMPPVDIVLPLGPYTPKTDEEDEE